MKILGWQVGRWVEKKDSTVREAELVAERIELKKQVAFLSKENLELRAKVKTPFIDADLGDPIPADSGARKEYVAMVAGLHKDFLEPKFKFMLSNVHKAMENELNTRKDDDMWRGAAYTLRELLRWGERMVNEQVGNQNNQK